MQIKKFENTICKKCNTVYHAENYIFCPGCCGRNQGQMGARRPRHHNDLDIGIIILGVIDIGVLTLLVKIILGVM